MDMSYREVGDRRRSSDSIAELFRAGIGADRVASEPAERVAETGLPGVTVYPRRIEELAEALRIAGSDGLRVLPAGAGTWFEMGNIPPLETHVFISTSKMDRILEYEPADLTATVEAGCTLHSFNDGAAKHRQFIPLDPFGNEEATLGAVAATASYGPLRCAYGTPRDWIIGMRVVHPGGRITKAGGKVVKNVAGYDLCKLYTGSFGTLGIIGELSFKLRALPSDDCTIVIFSDDLHSLARLVTHSLQSDLQPAAAELFSTARMQEAVPITKSFGLALRFLAELETITAQTDLLAKLSSNETMLALDEVNASLFWRTYRASEVAPEWSYILRLSVLPSDLSATFADIERLAPGAPICAHAASGVIRLHAYESWLDGLKTAQRPRRLVELRQAVQERGGSLVILRAPDEIKAKVDVWGDVGPNARLMREIKAKFDPGSQLNPGRFVSGI
jgi:glycolate dehydrogenase FAD-binding subunit